MAKKKKKEIVKEISGELIFQRTGQVLSFKAQTPEVFSNSLIQVPPGILPADYSPDKHDVTGDFVYRIKIKEK
jgi:hypothetical protein